MDYSMFSRPKLHDTKEMSYYPEYDYPIEQGHHHSNRHSHSVAPIQDDYQVVAAARRRHRGQRTPSMRPRCISEKKCPIYVHPIPSPPESFDPDQNQHLNHHTYRKVSNYLNDLHHIEQEPHIATRSQRASSGVRRPVDKSNKAVLTKLEESYWANWKPQKEPPQDSCLERASVSKGGRGRTHVKKHHRCKTAKKQGLDNELLTTVGQHECHAAQQMPPMKEPVALPIIDEERTRLHSNDCGDDAHMQVDSCEIDSECHNRSLGEVDEDKTTMVLYAGPGHRDEGVADDRTTAGETEEELPLHRLTSSELIEQGAQEEANRLKHTDSLILTKSRKQGEERKTYQQPKCIRLYKKPGPSTTAGLVRGGTYPLKSCLKKESSFGGKRNIRLGRPGSPLIVTSNYYNNFPRSLRK